MFILYFFWNHTLSETTYDAHVNGKSGPKLNCHFCFYVLYFYILVFVLNIFCWHVMLLYFFVFLLDVLSRLYLVFLQYRLRGLCQLNPCKLFLGCFVILFSHDPAGTFRHCKYGNKKKRSQQKQKQDCLITTFRPMCWKPHTCRHSFSSMSY